MATPHAVTVSALPASTDVLEKPLAVSAEPAPTQAQAAAAHPISLGAHAAEAVATSMASLPALAGSSMTSDVIVVPILAGLSTLGAPVELAAPPVTQIVAVTNAHADIATTSSTSLGPHTQVAAPDSIEATAASPFPVSAASLTAPVMLAAPPANLPLTSYILNAPSQERSAPGICMPDSDTQAPSRITTLGIPVEMASPPDFAAAAAATGPAIALSPASSLPVGSGEENSGSDPTTDPELELALRLSMEGSPPGSRVESSAVDSIAVISGDVTTLPSGGATAARDLTDEEQQLQQVRIVAAKVCVRSRFYSAFLR